MKKQFIIWIVIVFIEFIIGSTIGENKGTIYSFMFYPIIMTVVPGLIYFLFRMLKK